MALPGESIAITAASSTGEGVESEPPQGPSVGLNLDVVVEAGDWSGVGSGGHSGALALEALVAGAARAIAADAEVAAQFGGNLEACVAFTGDAEVRRLNAQYRGQDKATNVLSFAAGPQPVMPGAPVQSRFLGDIVLAAETIASEAAGLGIPMAHHVQHLVVHGVLHLMGLDHETDAEAQRMEARESLILASLGIADPYSPND